VSGVSALARPFTLVCMYHSAHTITKSHRDILHIFLFMSCIGSMLLDECDSQLSRGHLLYKCLSTADARLPFLDIGPLTFF
jgi:hypothetical protein